MKPRIQPYISRDNHERLQTLGRHPNTSESRIVDEALTAYFSGAADTIGGHAILRRLDRLTRQFDRLEQKALGQGETLALFVRYFMVTPPVPKEAQEAAQAQGDVRFESFLDQLARDLQSGRRILQRAMEDALADETDFFTEDELKRLHQPAPDRASSEQETAHA